MNKLEFNCYKIYLVWLQMVPKSEGKARTGFAEDLIVLFILASN